MGVKDLWSVLSPVCEKKSLWELENTAIAIDLSAWICDSQSVATSQANMYLRNLFFRTSYLLLLGVKPIFVLEGDAPKVKWTAIGKRMAARAGKAGGSCTGNSSRSRLKGLQNQCAQLLASMGLKCVKARGEAEAYCAHLNAQGIVSGVVTQDSDAFLYGAVEVYRNFQMSPNYTCDCYRMSDIRKKLNLSRNKLIGFSVLSGSDYNDGVSKLGRATATKFLASISDEEVFQKFLSWRDSSYFEVLKNDKFMTEQMQLEMTVRSKAVKDINFPYLDTIEEFIAEPQESEFVYEWSKPNLALFTGIAVKKLRWEEEYAAQKFLPIVGRWHLLNPGHPCDFSIVSIVGKGQGRNTNCYKVAWNQHDIVTPELKSLVAEAYPEIVANFEESKRKKKKPPVKPKQPKDISNQGLIMDVVENATNSLHDLSIEAMEMDENDFNLSNIINNLISLPDANPALST